MSRSAGRAEIVGHAADRDYQRVVGQAGRRRDLAAFVVLRAADQDLTRRPINADHIAETIREMVPVRLRQIIQLMLGAIQAARGHRVQQRLPQMRAAAFHQSDLRAARFRQLVAEPGHEFQAGRAAAHDDDPMWRGGRWWRRHVRGPGT